MLTTLRFRQILGSSTNPELRPDTMLRRVVGNILVIFFGINQPPGFLKITRLVANAPIVLAMSESTDLPSTHVRGLHDDEYVGDALILGQKTDENSCLMLLSEAGKLALLESTILPNYNQLRFLEGRSGIGALIIGVQAIGYVTSIVYRAIHHLQVSPIEVIGFVHSMFVIVGSGVHSVGVVCQYPLVMYLNPTQEQKMLEKCKSPTRWSDVDDLSCKNAMIRGLVVVGSVVVASTVFVSRQLFLQLGTLDFSGPFIIIAFLVIQLLISISITRRSESYLSKRLRLEKMKFMSFVGLIYSFVGVVVSIVATIVNWHTSKYDSGNPSVIHNLPFLG